MTENNTREIEAKWQKKWADSGIFKVDVNKLEDKYYVLVMFPYPSGDRLHMGHWWQYGVMDTWARFQRMRGKNVFFPMGFDAFGLPAENFAIKKGVHPDISTTENVRLMMEQFRRMGVSYNFEYPVNTSRADYYKWTQWVFLQLYKNGLAYKKSAPVNWCNSCQTVLANEQVVDGCCERCESEVVQKELEQWFFRITDYAGKLLDNLDGLDWPSKTVAMQKNWIGRSEGAEIDFGIVDHDSKFTVFTTRPDTLYGVTYVTFAPEHPLVGKITAPEQAEAVKAYVDMTHKATEIERLSTAREKTGCFTGAYAVHPLTGDQIPIWVGDYVLGSYGTGVVMAVPAHDERDFAFACKYNLPVKRVIKGSECILETEMEAAYTGDGLVLNSGPYDNMQSPEMREKIVADLEKCDKGRQRINYRLRDWLVSRQRYWGAPIPVVYCEKCGEQAVPESELPVRLPENVDFRPTGESPLKRCDEFINTSCPVCGGSARREADTLDTFVCSSWYYLRFPSANRQDVPFDKDITAKMLPVDKYVGGPEHACMHLLYARFICMVMKDLGYVNFEEPFLSLTHQGMVLGPDHQKMSKSKGNSVSPDNYVEDFGSDTLRLYLCFGFNYIDGGPWDDGGMKAVRKFFERLERLFGEFAAEKNSKKTAKTEYGPDEKQLLYVFHNAIKCATADTERFQFNTSVARYMELYNAITAYQKDCSDPDEGFLRQILSSFIILLSPFLPHYCEEWWEAFGNSESVFLQKWPEYEERYLQLDEITMAVMVNGKLRAQISVPAESTEEEVFIIAAANSKIQKYLGEGTLRKRIFVPGKLINLIIS
jgi:leucyl-tRNA synthetase